MRRAHVSKVTRFGVATAALVAGLFLLLVPRLAWAAGVLDQSSSFSGASFNVGTNTLVWQQQIQVGIAGQLEGINVSLTSPGAQTTITIRKGAAPNSTAAVFQQAVTSAATEPQFVDMSASNIVFAAGDLFVMEVQGNSGQSLEGNYTAPPRTTGLLPTALPQRNPVLEQRVEVRIPDLRPRELPARDRVQRPERVHDERHLPG
jgi:hypothetical protein